MVDTPDAAGIDRRSLLKKGAAAGAMVWAAPAVTNMSMAYATSTPGDGRYTNCAPSLSYTLIQTGPNCRGYNASVGPGGPYAGLGLPQLDPSCCDQSSYGIAIATPSCGPQCAADPYTPPGYPLPVNLTQVVAGQGSLKTSFSGGCNAPAGFALYNPGNCASAATTTLRIVSGVTCEDGTNFVIQEDVAFVLTNCPLVSNGTVVPGSRVIISCSGPSC